jgi:hypothetical protein
MQPLFGLGKRAITCTGESARSSAAQQKAGRCVQTLRRYFDIVVLLEEDPKSCAPTDIFHIHSTYHHQHSISVDDFLEDDAVLVAKNHGKMIMMYQNAYCRT